MIDEVKNKIDLVEFISESVPLRRAGNYYKGACPFHSEKTPSFFVSIEKQIWKCFGCGEGGSVIDFLMKKEGLEFKEALYQLAERAGIEIKSMASSQERNLILEINRVASRFFKNQLMENKMALSYLFERGLTEPTIAYFDLGYAPGQNELRDYLFSLGYRLNDIQRAGFLTYGQEDRFRSRIMFPLIDHTGKVVGFTGRIYPINNEVTKYLNSPETELFKKSQFLYGLYSAALPIKEKKEVIVVEGQMDFLSAWQAGVTNVAAVSGTALTEDQLRLLKRYCHKILFAFDEDEAGLRATLRSAPLATRLGFEIRKLAFPSGKDLGDYLLKGKIEDCQDVALLDYLLSYGRAHFDLQIVEGKKKLLELILPQIKFTDVVLRQHWLTQVSALIHIPESLLLEELNQLPTSAQNKTQGRSRGTVPVHQFEDKYLNLTERLLAIVLAVKRIELLDELSEYFSLKRDLISRIKAGHWDEETELLRLRGAYEQEQNQDLEKELSFMIKELKKEYFKRKIQELKSDLMAEADQTQLDQILQSVKHYTESLKSIENCNW